MFALSLGLVWLRMRTSAFRLSKTNQQRVAGSHPVFQTAELIRGYRLTDKVGNGSNLQVKSQVAGVDFNGILGFDQGA
jgi:hypothetical protein